MFQPCWRGFRNILKNIFRRCQKVQKVLDGRVTFWITLFLSRRTYRCILSKYTESRTTRQVELPILNHLPQFIHVSSRRQLLSFQIDAFSSPCQPVAAGQHFNGSQRLSLEFAGRRSQGQDAGRRGVADALPSRGGLAAEILRSNCCKSVNKWKPETHVYVAVCSQLVIYGILSRDVNSVIKGSQLILSGVVNVFRSKSLRESGFLGKLKIRKLSLHKQQIRR